MLKVSAPARICLFGDHQDYLGLPVIACAINRSIQIEIADTRESYIKLIYHDLDKEEVFHLDDLDKLQPEIGHHAAWVFSVLFDRGWSPKKGCILHVKGTIPINAGLSSSSALVIALIRAIHNYYALPFALNERLCAEIAYEAEVLRQVGPGGKMDQYTIAHGGTLMLETDEVSAVHPLPNPACSIIIGESGQAKNTIGLLQSLRTKALAAFEIIKKKEPTFDPKTIDESEVQNLAQKLPESLKLIFTAACTNYQITRSAFELLRHSTQDIAQLGQLMNAHHAQLKDALGITTPLIDNMIEAANQSGALGAKIVGSGGGGCIGVLSHPNKVSRIMEAIVKAGAKDAYEVSVSPAVHSQKP